MKKILSFITCIAAAVIVTAQTPAFQWAKQIGGSGTGSTNTGNAITVDFFGNVYTTGAFTGTADFDPGIGVFNMTAIGSSNIFISKFDASGNFVWAKQIGNISSNSGSAILLGVSNCIYVTGAFMGTVDFDPGPGTTNLTSNGTYDIFILKLDPSGNFVWAKGIGGTNSDVGSSIALDTLENIYVTGRFCFGSVDFDPGIGVFNLNGIANQNIFVAKFDASGSLVWAKHLGDGGEGSGSEIKLDQFNNVFITGTFRGLSSDFDPNAGTYILNTGGYSGVFISKLTSAGNFVWAKQLAQNNNTFGHAYGFAMALDAAGNVYTTGMFNDTVDFNPGAITYYLSSASYNQADCFVSKLSPTGSFIWARKIGTYHDTSFENEGHSVAVDDTGNVYITGSFGDTVDFDPGIGVYNMIGGLPNGFSDGFVLKLNPSGNFAWARQFSSAGRGNSIIIDALKNFYITGNFGGTVDFDFGLPIYNLTAFAYDIFIHKMGPCASPSATITPAGPTIFCTGGSVVLNANTGAGLNYQWKLNTTAISGATNSSYTSTTAGSYTVVVTNSCGSAASSATTVTVNSLPSATITAAGATTFCTGGSVVLNAPVAANRTYQWKKNGNLVAGATLSSYTATTTGNYKVIVTNAATGCSKTTSNATAVTVNALPVATVTPQGPTNFCAGGSVVLQANTGAGLTYKWKKSGSFISGATLSNYTATTAGTYKVEVKNSNGCSKLSAGIVVTVPCREGDISSIRSNLNFNVYPNPNAGEFTIEFSIHPTFPIQIEMTDALGRVVKKFETDDETIMIKESNLANGIYCLTVRNEDQVSIKKINIIR